MPTCTPPPPESEFAADLPFAAPALRRFLAGLLDLLRFAEHRGPALDNPD